MFYVIITDELHEILLMEKPADYSLQFYSNYIQVILSTFYMVYRSYVDIRYLVRILSWFSNYFTNLLVVSFAEYAICQLYGACFYLQIRIQKSRGYLVNQRFTKAQMFVIWLIGS